MTDLDEVNEMALAASEPLQVELLKTNTVLDLKKAILAAFGKNLDPKTLRVRRTGGGNSIGAPLPDNSTLHETKLDYFERVILERGDVPPEEHNVQFLVGKKRRRLEDSPVYSIGLRLDWTVEEAIEEMKKLVGLTEPHKLYTTDMWEKPDKIAADSNVRIRTLRCLDELLWLEEGQVRFIVFS